MKTERPNLLLRSTKALILLGLLSPVLSNASALTWTTTNPANTVWTAANVWDGPATWVNGDSASFTTSPVVNLGTAISQTGVTISSGQTLTLNLTADSKITGVGGFTGDLIKTGGNLRLSHTGGFNGTLTVNSNYLILGSASADPTGQTSNATKLVANGGGIIIGSAYNGGSLTIGELSGTSGTVRTDWADGGTNAKRTLIVDQSTNTSYSGTFVEGSSNRFFDLVKTGAGTLTLNGNSTGWTVGNASVTGGTLRIGGTGALGAVQAGSPATQVTASAGGTVDLNGAAVTYGYTISGTGVGGNGALVNNGSAIGNNLAQTNKIKLAANASIGGSGNWSLIAGSYGATSLDLNGVTLTKSGANTIGLATTTTTAGTVSIAGGTLELGVSNGGSGVTGSASAFTLDNTSGAVLNVVRSSSVGSLSGGGATGGNVSIATGTTLTVGALGATTSFGGVISGAGAMSTTGAGTFTLTGANTYSGGTTINGGVLNMNHARATGSNGGTSRNMTIKSGQLNLGWSSATGAYGSGTTNYAVLFTNLTMGGTGGATSLLSSSGVISSNPVGFGVGPGTGGSLSYDATNNGGIATISAFWASSGTSGTGPTTVTVGDSSATSLELDFTGRISNTGQIDGRGITLDKAGLGAMRISAANNYPRVQVTDGTLIVNHANALGVSRTGDGGLSNLVTVNGGTLDLNGFNNTIGGLTGTGGVITNNGAGASTLAAGNANGSTSFSGAIQNGTGVVGLTKQGSGTLTLTGATTFTGTITAVGGTISFTDLPDGGVIAYNGGTVQFAGASADTSNRGIQIGTVGGGITSTLNSSGTGALDMTSTAPVTNGGTLTAGAGLRLGGTNTGDNTFRGLLPNLSSVAIKLTKQDAGRWLVTNDNTFTGEVTLSGGTLSVPKVAALGVAQPLGQGTSAIAISNGARLEYTGVSGSTNRGLQLSGTLGGAVDVDTGSTLALSGAISGSSSQFRKGGAGTFNFSGSGTWGNDFYVDAGVMNISGSVVNGGSLAAITIAPAATLRITGGGDVQGTIVDVQSGGTVSLEGGVLRTPNITQASPGGFVWSGGTLTTRVSNPSVLAGDGVDVSGAGGPEVFTGRLGTSDRTLEVSGDLTVAGNTNLDLGDLYLSSGVIYNSIRISGSLNVSSGTLTLTSLDTAYLLRPSNGGTPTDHGTLVLLEAASISGITPSGLGFTGLTFIAPTSDSGRSLDQYTGGGWPLSGDPGNLPVDTWHLEVTPTQILFHYHVSAAIPEPASAGLMIAGAILLRTLSRRRPVS